MFIERCFCLGEMVRLVENYRNTDMDKKKSLVSQHTQKISEGYSSQRVLLLLLLLAKRNKATVTFHKRKRVSL